MKNQSKIFIVLLAVSSLCFTACKKFLDIQPVDKISQNTLFQNEQGFKDALNGVYLNMDKGSVGTNGLYTNNLTLGLLSAMAYNYDNSQAATTGSSGTAIVDGATYKYTTTVFEAEMTVIWQGMYNNIANINNILKQIEDKKDVFTGNNYQLIRGEALGLRAMLHFDLLRMFGKAPVIDPNSKAIPYVKEFNLKTNPLLTVNEVLEQCITDLRTAKNILATTDTTAILKGVIDPFTSYTQNHFNYWATQGLLARAYLYKGVPDSAAFFAKAVIGSNKFPSVTSNVAAAANTVRDRTFYQEQIFSLYSLNLLTINQKLFDNSNPLKLLPAFKTAVYTAGNGSTTDYRFISWFDNNANNVNVMSKFFQDKNLPYNLQGIVPLIRISEMYYIAAECANTAGNTSQGITYLNKVRISRGLTALPANTTSAILDSELINEYKKEFIGEGQSFFFFKRLNKDLKVVTTTPATIPADVYVFPIPDAELEYLIK